jgi:long-chain acyl-CoA synthetase
MNVATNLDYAAFHFPDHIAVIEVDRSVSFAEFKRDADQIASALVSMGVQPGDHVALCASNSYAWLVFYFGALKAGAVAVTFSHLLMKDELSRTLADCEPKVLFTADEKLEDLGDYRQGPHPELVVCDHGDISYPRLAEKGASEFKTVERHRHDTAAILSRITNVQPKMIEPFVFCL